MEPVTTAVLPVRSKRSSTGTWSLLKCVRDAVRRRLRTVGPPAVGTVRIEPLRSQLYEARHGTARIHICAVRVERSSHVSGAGVRDTPESRVTSATAVAPSQSRRAVIRAARSPAPHAAGPQLRGYSPGYIARFDCTSQRLTAQDRPSPPDPIPRRRAEPVDDFRCPREGLGTLARPTRPADAHKEPAGRRQYRAVGRGRS